jgi:hypothetical protein
MKTQVTLLLFLAAFSPVLIAGVDGSIQKLDGNVVKAKSIEAETLSGVEWKNENKTLGTRIEVWDVDQVRYTAKNMDQFNNLAKKMRAGKGDALEKDAQSYLDKPEASITDDGDKLRIKLTCRYYIARAKLLQAQYADAAIAFLQYMKDCEESIAKAGPNKPNIPDNWVRGVAFDSPTGNKVAEAGLLHRLYLDALEGLGDAYARDNKTDDANKKAYERLVKLTGDLNQRSSKPEYFDWAMRALKAAAAVAESGEKPDLKRALKCYEDLALVALKRNAGKPNRDSNEARLKSGFLLVKDGQLAQAQTLFSGAIREWEKDQKNFEKGFIGGWISPDKSYMVAGSYVGIGMVRIENAKKANDSESWASALTQFSQSLTIFVTDPEFRAMALMKSARCCAELATLAQKKDKAVATRHVETAEKYLLELKVTLGSSKAAGDPEVVEITKLIDKCK